MDISAATIQTGVLVLTILIHAAIVAYQFGKLSAQVEGVEKRLTTIERHFFEMLQKESV